MENTDIHWVSLAKSTAISQYYFSDFITPLEVIAVLHETKVSFMLVGHHGLCGWMKKPRATEDVDVLVAARQHKKAVRELLRAFPQLEAVNHPTVTRLRDRQTERVAIDVLLPNRPPYRDALKHTYPVTVRGREYRIPTLELAITMKFAALSDTLRSLTDKYQDAHDFMRLVLVNAEINLEKLSKLGDLIHSSGGQELLEMVRKVRAGEKLIL